MKQVAKINFFIRLNFKKKPKKNKKKSKNQLKFKVVCGTMHRFPQKKMKEAEILKKLNEAVFATKSSISAVEKWSKMLAKKYGIEADPISDIAENLPKIAKSVAEDEKTIEGVFDGQNMVAVDETKYPVPPNYASKSKLVFGDKLKLTIQPNGAFVYKQIELVPRKLLVGNLILDGSQYKVLADGREYDVLYASVTFLRAKVGDEITIIVPENGESQWAAVENVLPR